MAQESDQTRRGEPPYLHEPGVRYTANGWAIKKQINYGDMIGFATVIVAIIIPLSIAFLSWANTVSHQVTVNDQRIDAQGQKNVQQDQRIDRLEARTDRSLRSVETKLDRLNENLLMYIRQSSKDDK